jgi:hypothetical protein
MNQEHLEERLKLLETERTQVLNTAVAYEGAIQETKYWLSKVVDKQNDS